MTQGGWVQVITQYTTIIIIDFFLARFFFKDSDGYKVTDSKKIANNFNEFFTNFGTKLANKISSPDSNYVSPLKSKNQQNSIF